MTTILPEATPKPCNDCPWRRNAAQGWLGPYSAEEWIRLAHTDEPIACHCTIKESGNWEGTKQCRGAASYRANLAKSPRDPAVVTGPVDREHVFDNPQDFIDYHKPIRDQIKEEASV